MKRSLSSAFAVLLSLTLLGAAHSRGDEFLPPPVAPVHGAVTATTAYAPVSRLRLGQLDIVLEETPLAIVQEMLSMGAIGERVEAAEHIFWLCYTYDIDGVRARIWLVSSGEFGGAEHAVDGVAAAVVNTEGSIPANCPALRAGEVGSITQMPLEIGRAHV